MDGRVRNAVPGEPGPEPVLRPGDRRPVRVRGSGRACTGAQPHVQHVGYANVHGRPAARAAPAANAVLPEIFSASFSSTVATTEPGGADSATPAADWAT